jgi:hypothetical protein
MPSLVDHRHRPAVRDQPERVSAFIRNRCPGSSGIGVRKQPDYSPAGPLVRSCGCPCPSEVRRASNRPEHPVLTGLSTRPGPESSVNVHHSCCTRLSALLGSLTSIYPGPLDPAQPSIPRETTSQLASVLQPGRVRSRHPPQRQPSGGIINTTNLSVEPRQLHWGATRGCGHHRSICRLERRVVHLASQDRHLMKQDHDLDREVRISATDEADQL